MGREEVITELERRIGEGIHTMLTGARRTGKTTVCNAVCERMSEAGAIVVKIEVPESADATALLQSVLEHSRKEGALLRAGGRVFRAAEPVLEKVLEEQGLPLDLSQLRPGASPQTVRKIIELPLKMAEKTGQPVILYLDEVQRMVDYADGEGLLGDLVDVYGGRTEAVLLVDGSSERALEQMMVPPVGFGKLVDRLPLPDEIPLQIWRVGLPRRFEQAGLDLAPEALEALNSYGRGPPYATMSAARYAALNARKLGSASVGPFEATEGVAEARRHLAEDEI